MSAAVRKGLLTTHIVFSVGWLGAVAAFLVLAIAGLVADDANVSRSSYVVMELVAWFVIVPLAAGSLVTGVIQGLISSWGLFRHYWVVAKLLITAVATVVLIGQLEPIEMIAGAAGEGGLPEGALREARLSLVVHAGGGLLVLLVPAMLSVYKPRGRTRHGARRQLEAELTR
jgi:hypothetical protein